MSQYTIRNILNKLNFDWNTGIIIIKPHNNDIKKTVLRHPFPPIETDPDKKKDKYLDYYFCEFIAQDNIATYFQVTYDNSCWYEKIYKDISFYAQDAVKTPSFGG